MKRVRSRRDVTGLTSTLTRGKVTHMPETRPSAETAAAPPTMEGTAVPDLFDKVRTHDRRDLIAMAREQDLLPYFREVESRSGPVVRREGQDRLMRGSNTSLGRPGAPRAKQAAQRRAGEPRAVALQRALR